MDRYGIINNAGQREITLQKICDVIGIQVPERFNDVKDIVNNNVVTKLDLATKGSCLFQIIKIRKKNFPDAEWFEEAEKKGVIAIFVDEEQYYRNGLDKTDYPIIPVSDLIDKCGAFYSYIKDLNNVKTLAVTGTCGKTTTMKFLQSIIPNHYKTYSNKGNANSFFTIAKHIMHELTDDKEIYLQEAGASGPDSIRKSAAMLKPDAFILLNIFRHHLNTYKTQENILNDKASFDDYLQEGGVVIANFDDELIKNYGFKHKVISFGVHTEDEVDYKVVRVEQKSSSLEVDIKYEDKLVPIKVEILGVQNAYNVAAAFALCKWLGLSDEKILEGFGTYESAGYRQNFRNVGGHDLLIDCYNVCEDSMRASFETIRLLPLEEGNKKVAVITGENKLAKQAEELSFRMGSELDLKDIDHVICFGVEEETQYNLNKYCHTRAVYEGIKSTGYENVTYVNTLDDLETAIRDNVSVGDKVLFKGMYNMDLTTVIDRVFGTAISMNNPYYVKDAVAVSEKKFEGKKIKAVEGIDLISVPDKNAKNMIIPDYVDGRPIHRIAPDMFRACTKIKSVELGKTVKNIGRNAFAGCVGLKKITIPGNVKVIEKGAFFGCLGLKEVVIDEGVTHIDKDAFKNCIRLKSVSVPDSVKYIDESAFSNCPFLKNKELKK